MGPMVPTYSGNCPLALSVETAAQYPRSPRRIQVQVFIVRYAGLCGEMHSGCGLDANAVDRSAFPSEPGQDELPVEFAQELPEFWSLVLVEEEPVPGFEERSDVDVVTASGFEYLTLDRFG